MPKMFVRLKKYDPSRGNLRITYVAPWGVKYECGFWHEVDTDADENAGAALDYLRTIRQSMDKASPLAFDVCDLRTAQSMIDYEERARLGLLRHDSDADKKGPVAPLSLGGTKPSKTLNAPPKVHELQRRAEPSTVAVPIDDDDDDDDAPADVVETVSLRPTAIEPEPKPEPKPASKPARRRIAPRPPK